MAEQGDVINIREFDIQDFPMSATVFIIGPPGSGKTTFIENVMYYNKHKYPVGRAFIGTETAYERFKDIMGPLYVSNKYNQQELHQEIVRQKTCITENGRGYFGNYSILMMDDIADDSKIFRHPEIRGLFKNGSQHWHQLVLFGNQYAIDVPPDVRKSVSYVVIFREPEPNERRKLYDNFGGSVGSFEVFCYLLDQIVEQFHCLVIQKRSQSNKLEENVFYYKTKQITKKWKFGCNEMKEWEKERYNKDYQEKFV